MIAFLWHWFDWPQGAVLTNLVASACWVGFAAWKAIRKFDAVHDHLDDVHEHLRLVHEHVNEIHAHQLAHAEPKPPGRQA